MKQKYSSFIFGIILTVTLGCGLFFFQKSQAAEGDVIGMRIYPNPNHVSALRWYQEGPFPKGSPQQMTIDGYQAIRDGRTAYVNAANVDTAAGTFYTNIYVLSFNQSAELATEDIFGRLLARWRFNTNLDSETGFCSEATSTKCITVDDCSGLGYCSNFKSKTIRDTLRMENLADIRSSLEAYVKKEKKYPDLAAGSYYTNRTLSVWPSWQDTLGAKLGKKLPIDPINQLAPCAANFDPITCWDQTSKSFAWASQLNAGTIPADNYTYLYRNGNQGSSYNLCAYSETGLIPATERCNAVCLPFCFEKNCGPDRCGGSCGTCMSGATCTVSGACTSNCVSSLGCLSSLTNAAEVPGYCSGSLKCLECQAGFKNVSGTCISACSSDGCNGICPPYCPVTSDPDCDFDGCCGDGLCKGGETHTSCPADCPLPCSPDGCNGSCPTNCTALQDPDCGSGICCGNDVCNTPTENTSSCPGDCPVLCGNGANNPGEACDDANLSNGDGCNSTCQIESGWTCSGWPSVCTLISVCGNGIIQSGESCDQGGGNTTNGDGCNSACQIEGGWTCAGQPSVCTLIPVCGNGIIQTGEICDDDNIANGDGCNAACQVEINWTCIGAPSICTPNSQTVACVGLPVNASWNSLATVLQIWTGSSWSPSNAGIYNTTPGICTFACNPSYAWSGSSCDLTAPAYCTFDSVPASAFDTCPISP